MTKTTESRSVKRSPRPLVPLADRGPLRVLFAVTSMPVGGAETLLVNLFQRLNPEHCLPELVCLKEPGPLGESLSQQFPVHSRLIRHRWDWRVIGRLRELMRSRRIDALVTVGAGDKMFWGRLAAWRERLPVICSAIHSTGWPDGISRLNRLLTPLNDAFIAVAEHHGRHLIENEGLPPEKVFVIPNGVDAQRFKPLPESGLAVRRQLGIRDQAPVVGIVAALRPEKNHEQFLRAAALTKRQLPDSQFLVVGDGPLQPALKELAASLGIGNQVHFLGNRSDIPRLLAAMDVFALTSRNEANPVSILESLACGVPVVAPRVGSIPEMIQDEYTGYLVAPGDVDETANRWVELLSHSGLRLRFGLAGRELVVAKASLERMVAGYERLLADLYQQKANTLAVSSKAPGSPTANKGAGGPRTTGV